jgi:hypothetical protein
MKSIAASRVRHLPDADYVDFPLADGNAAWECSPAVYQEGRRSLMRGRRATAVVAMAGFLVLVFSIFSGTALAASTPPVMRVGKAAGPYPIAGGSTLKEVAHQTLPAGNWTVFLKAEIDNTSTSSLHLHPAQCELFVGNDAQGATVNPTWKPFDDSRQAIMLTVSGHLTATGRASLKCDAIGSATGVDTIRQIQMTAMKSTALSLGSLPYTNYGNQSSLSHVYQAHNTGQATLTGANTFHQVVHMTLPAGDWAVTATATLYGSSGSGVVTCQIVTGSDFDQVKIPITPPGDVDDRANVMEQVDHVSGSAWQATLQCAADGNSVGAFLMDSMLTAYRAQTVLNQPVNGDDTYPSQPATVKPLVLGGWNDGPYALGANAAPAGVSDQMLQAGKWVVVAKGWLNHSSTGIEHINCTLGTQLSTDKLSLVLPASTTIDAVQPFTLMWSGSLSAKTKVGLRCSAPTGNLTVNFVKLNAYRAGTLTAVAIR